MCVCVCVCVCVKFSLCVFCGCPVSLLPCRLFSSCDVQVSHCGGFSRCRAWALGQARGFSSCDSWILECRLHSWGPWIFLLHNLWDLPGSGIVSVSPVLAGEFFITESLEKPNSSFYNMKGSETYCCLH